MNESHKQIYSTEQNGQQSNCEPSVYSSNIPPREVQKKQISVTKSAHNFFLISKNLYRQKFKKS